MARDTGLEEQLAEDLGDLDGLHCTPIFGGLAWLWRGGLLCAASSRGILYRLGKGNADWARGEKGIEPMIMGGRPMDGWVRLTPEEAGNQDLRLRLLADAKAFVASLPPK
jgi:hypothetical protein